MKAFAYHLYFLAYQPEKRYTKSSLRDTPTADSGLPKQEALQ